MAQGRKALTDGRNARRIDRSGCHARPFLYYGNDLAPWVDQHAVAPGPAAVFVFAALRGGQHVALVFDRARLEQRVPVRLARRVGERGRHDHQRAIAHFSVKLGKPQVVAHRQPDASEWRIKRTHFASRTDRAGFVEGFRPFLEIEEMNLVVAGNLLTGWIEDQGGIEHTRGFRRFHGQGSADHPYAMLARRVRQELLDRTMAGRLADRELVRVLETHVAEVFRQQHKLRAIARGFGNQPSRFRYIALTIRRTHHLQRGYAERPGVERSGDAFA